MPIDNIPNTIVSNSQVHGQGLFAASTIAKGTQLCFLDGQVVNIKDLPSNEVISLEWNALPDDKVLVRPVRTKYYYINHSRTPNAEVSLSDDGRLGIIAVTDLKPGDELLLDYRREPLPDEYLNGHGSTYL